MCFSGSDKRLINVQLCRFCEILTLIWPMATNIVHSYYVLILLFSDLNLAYPDYFGD